MVGLENVFVNRVACGSSHSLAWCLPHSPAEENTKEPVAFSTCKDPLGGNSLGIYDSELQTMPTTGSSKISLSETLLSLKSYGAKQAALGHVLNAMSIIQARQCVVAALTSHSQLSTIAEKVTDHDSFLKELEGMHDSNQSNEQIAQGGGEGPAERPSFSTLDAENDVMLYGPAIAPSAFQSLTESMSTSVSSVNGKHSKMSASAMSVMAATMTHQDEVISGHGFSGLDEFTSLLGETEARHLIELLKLSVAGRTGCASTRQTIANTLVALAMNMPSITNMMLETCITELEDLCTSRHFLGKMPKPVVQETSHPYIDDVTLVGHVRIPGAEALRLEFDSQCSTEKRNDPLVLMDGCGRVLATRSGRECAQWAPNIIIPGDEMRWKFTSDGNVNGWGWKFWVHAVMPPFFNQKLG